MKFLRIPEDIRSTFTHHNVQGSHTLAILGAYYEHPEKGIWLFYKGPKDITYDLYVKVCRRSFLKENPYSLVSQWDPHEEQGALGMDHDTCVRYGPPPKLLMSRVMRHINENMETLHKVLVEQEYSWIHTT